MITDLFALALTRALPEAWAVYVSTHRHPPSTDAELLALVELCPVEFRVPEVTAALLGLSMPERDVLTAALARGQCTGCGRRVSANRERCRECRDLGAAL